MRSHLHCKGLTGGNVQVTLVGELLRSANGELTLQPLSQEQAGEAEFHKMTDSIHFQRLSDLQGLNVKACESYSGLMRLAILAQSLVERSRGNEPRGKRPALQRQVIWSSWRPGEVELEEKKQL